jgi:amino acid permease
VREPGDGFVFAEVPVYTAFCQAASVFLYSFCCHFNLFPVAETLTEPTRARCRALGWATTVLQTCLYAAVGFAGYSTWHQALLRMGNNSGNVLWCWGVQDIAMTLGRTLMILTLVLSLTLNFHPVRENIMRLIFECTPRRARLRWLVRTCAVDPVGHASMPGMSPSSTLPTHADLFTVENARSWIYGAVTVLVLALCVYVSYVVPSVLDVLGFVGGVAGVSLMFLFPGLLYVKTHSIDPKVGAVLTLFTAVGFLGLSAATFSVVEVVGGKS